MIHKPRCFWRPNRTIQLQHIQWTELTGSYDRSDKRTI